MVRGFGQFSHIIAGADLTQAGVSSSGFDCKIMPRSSQFGQDKTGIGKFKIGVRDIEIDGWGPEARQLWSDGPSSQYPADGQPTPTYARLADLQCPRAVPRIGGD